jgi:hypothetical protein
MVGPPDVPISNSFLLLNYPPKLFSNLLDDSILCVRDIDNNFFGLGFVSHLRDGNVLRRIISINLD